MILRSAFYVKCSYQYGSIFSLRMWSTPLLRTIDNIIAGSVTCLLLLLLLFVQFRQRALFSLMLITLFLVTSHCILNENFTRILYRLCCNVMMRNVTIFPLKSTSDWHAVSLFPYSTLSLR